MINKSFKNSHMKKITNLLNKIIYLSKTRYILLHKLFRMQRVFGGLRG